MTLMTVRSIMSLKGSNIISTTPNSTVYDALKTMADKNVGALVVLDGERLLGIISERDYARKIVLLGRTSLDTKVSDIMSQKVICTTPDQSVQECMALMTAKTIRHLPVLEHKKVVGMISIGDLVKAIISDQKFVIEQLENYIAGYH